MVCTYNTSAINSRYGQLRTDPLGLHCPLTEWVVYLDRLSSRPKYLPAKQRTSVGSAQRTYF